MKRCPYCGTQYSDEYSVCATDESPLEAFDPKPPKPHRAVAVSKATGQRSSFLITRIFNAFVAGIIMLFGMAGVAHTPLNVVNFTFLIIALCWLAGAIGLFFGLRWAWAASLLGVGFMFCGSAFFFAVGIEHLPGAHDPTDGTGIALLMGTFGLCISLGLIVCLLRLKRKTTSKMPVNQMP